MEAEGAESCRGVAHPIKSMARRRFDKTWVWGKVGRVGGADTGVPQCMNVQYSGGAEGVEVCGGCA